VPSDFGVYGYLNRRGVIACVFCRFAFGIRYRVEELRSKTQTKGIEKAPGNGDLYRGNRLILVRYNIHRIKLSTALVLKYETEYVIQFRYDRTAIAELTIS
jgi:hypothetical protein